MARELSHRYQDTQALARDLRAYLFGDDAVMKWRAFLAEATSLIEP